MATPSEAFQTIGMTFRETLGGVVDAVKTGDLEREFQVAGAGIKVVWFELIGALPKAFANLLRDIHAGLAGAGAGARIGRFFGPGGAVVGGGIGLLAGGGAAGAAADRALLEGWLDAAGGRLGRRPREAAAELARLRAEAVRAAAEPVMVGGGERDIDAELRKLGDSVRGAFSGASALQRFGFADTLAKMQLDNLKEINAKAGGIADGVRDLMGLFRLR